MVNKSHRRIGLIRLSGWSVGCRAVAPPRALSDRNSQKEVLAFLKACLICGSSWLFFFNAATNIQILGFSPEFAENPSNGEFDIFAGHLPTPIKVGG